MRRTPEEIKQAIDQRRRELTMQAAARKKMLGTTFLCLFLIALIPSFLWLQQRFNRIDPIVDSGALTGFYGDSTPSASTSAPSHPTSSPAQSDPPVADNPGGLIPPGQSDPPVTDNPGEHTPPGQTNPPVTDNPGEHTPPGQTNPPVTDNPGNPLSPGSTDFSLSGITNHRPPGNGRPDTTGSMDTALTLRPPFSAYGTGGHINDNRNLPPIAANSYFAAFLCKFPVDETLGSGGLYSTDGSAVRSVLKQSSRITLAPPPDIPVSHAAPKKEEKPDDPDSGKSF